MAEIRFETGERAYDVNGVCQVRFNPTDMEFARRLCDTFALLEGKQSGAAAAGDLFGQGKALDGEMRALLDGLFGEPVCQALFGDMNVCALAQGLPVWCNLLLAVMDEIRAAVEAEAAEINPRIAAYTARYAR